MYFITQSTEAYVTYFDLLFLLAALVTAVMICVSAALLLLGRGRQALRLLLFYAAGAITYLAIGIAISFFMPQRVMAVGEPWCLDDWCLEAQNVAKTPEGATSVYRVELRIFSRARRVSQRAKGAWIFVIDDRGRRYSPERDDPSVPLDVFLSPLESVTTSRAFRVPSDAKSLGLITGHGGPYCGVMSFAVMGQSGCLFNKPTMIRLQ